MATVTDKDPDKDTAPKGGKSDEAERDYIWVVSNRKDDRVVLHERDPRHPGGEVFIGGPTPDRAFKTAEIVRLIFSGEIVEIPEPPDGPKKPIEVEAVVQYATPAQPGQAIKLGREFDPDLVPKGVLKAVQARQAQVPSSIASKATVPPPPKDTETQTG